MNGRCIRWNEATLHVSSHALHYGTGIFEGMRCYDGDDGPSIFCLDEHLRRFFASANAYCIEIPYKEDQIREGIFDVIAGNGFSSCYVRPICYFGSDTLGVHPRSCPVEMAILTWPWGAYLGESGVRVTVSSWEKFSSRAMPATAKACGQYLNSNLAVRQAVSRGYDEAILLNSDGTIAEGSGENLFLVWDGRLITNDESSSILLGVTRSVVIEIARDLGYEVEVRPIVLDDLLGADEAFFTGTATEVAPIREVDGTVIGTGNPGRITAEIQRVFVDTTLGRVPRYKKWLHPVRRQQSTDGSQNIGVTRPRERSRDSRAAI
jgi:branched-chain amino acid aminotransferase